MNALSMIVLALCCMASAIHSLPYIDYTATLERIQAEGFLSIDTAFERAKNSKTNQTAELEHILDHIYSVKMIITLLQNELHEKLTLAEQSNFMDRVGLEVDRLTANKVDEALTEIGKEILAYKVNMTRHHFTIRHYSQALDLVIQSEMTKLSGLNQLGLTAQTLLNQALKPETSVEAKDKLRGQIQKKLSQIISDTDEIVDKVSGQYAKELVALSLEHNTDLNLWQKFYTVRVVSMSAYVNRFAKETSALVDKMLAVHH